MLINKDYIIIDNCVSVDERDRDYCEWESLNASCSASGHVIVIREARYGRMRVGRCVGQSYGHIGCGSDVTDTLHSSCSGVVTGQFL